MASHPAHCLFTAISVYPASLQTLWFLQTRVCEQLSVPKSKRGAERSLELNLDAVNDPRLLRVHQRQQPGLVVEQDAHTVRLPHQRHRHHLIAGHGEPLALSIAEHPGGAVGSHAVVSGHQGLGHTQTKLLRLFDRHLPVVSPAADLLVTEHDGPVTETLRVVGHVAGVQAQHAVDDAGVFLEEVQTAVGCSFIKPELQVYRESQNKQEAFNLRSDEFDI